MKIHLRDQNIDLVRAWEREFRGADDVTISHGDIFGASADAIVSPANSFGFMDGGIDLVYSQHFGWSLQERLQDLLGSEHDGELPVGEAALLETNDSAIPWLVSAPTMRVPMDVSDTVNAFLAFRAVIRVVRKFNAISTQTIRTVLCPGLGTAVGRMKPDVCARQMHHAYATSLRGNIARPFSLGVAVDAHFRLRG